MSQGTIQTLIPQTAYPGPPGTVCEITGLKNQPDIKIGRGLNHWLKYKISDWSRRHYYFDHNDPKIELMLQLICPGIIRTTMPIIEVNN